MILAEQDDERQDGRATFGPTMAALHAPTPEEVNPALLMAS